MNFFTLIVVMVMIAVVSLLVVFISGWTNRQNRLSRAERNELNSLRLLMETLDGMAYDHRELDSLLAPQVIDEIRKHRREVSA